MSKPVGSGRAFQQAKRTVAKLLAVETMVEENVLDAVNKMATILQDSKAPVAIQLSAAKFFIEAHAKFAKRHGLNPQPKDFVINNEKSVEEDVDNVINLRFKG